MRSSVNLQISNSSFFLKFALRLHPFLAGWRTMLVVPELEKEVELLSTFRDTRKVEQKDVKYLAAVHSKDRPSVVTTSRVASCYNLHFFFHFPL